MTYYGAQKVVEHYNIMGPIKAALECVMRYMAAELGSKGIRVHAISPGPIKTGAGYRIDHFEEPLTQEALRSPMRRPITFQDVGNVAVCLARLVVADINEAKLQFARKHGAVATVNTRSENATEEILAVSGSRKGKAVFDFVGIQSTIDLDIAQEESPAYGDGSARRAH